MNTLAFKLQGAARSVIGTNLSLSILLWVSVAWFAVAVAGMVLDPRMVLGMPNWSKSAKFAISVGIYSASLLGLLTYVSPGRERRIAGIAGHVIGIALLIETGVILVQSVRGVPSHFNASDAANAAMWGVMAVSISVFWIAFAVMIVALWRQLSADPVIKWSIRLGVLISFVGFIQGYLMTGPTPAQLAALEAGGMPSLIGAHTVGAPDGGAGLPVLGWSTEHGDLRIGHFLGTHALQVVPLIGLFLHRKQGLATQIRVRLLWLGATGWLAMLVITTWQALRGESIVSPGALTLAVSVAFYSVLFLLAVLVLAGAKAKPPCAIGRPGTNEIVALP